MPQFVPPEAQDLISKMLKVDPLERYTINDVKYGLSYNVQIIAELLNRAHPFFLKDVAVYIADPDFLADDFIYQESIDQEIIEKMVKLGISREKIMESLLILKKRSIEDSQKKIDGTSFAPIPDEDPDLRVVSVTYNILVEDRKKKEKKSSMDFFSNFFPTFDVEKFFKAPEEKEEAILLLPKRSNSITAMNENLAAFFQHHPRDWNVGICIDFSIDAPRLMVIIFEILRAMKNLVCKSLSSHSL